MSLDHFPATASLVPLLLFILLLSSSHSASAKHGCSVDAIINFGDSLSDTGNFVHISPLAFLSNRYPYGVTINKTTGRFSDGYLMIDFIAMRLGLPLLPPYLDRNASFANGVNFAVAGATALDASFLASNGITNPSTNVSLGVQLGWFRDYKRSLCPPPKNEFFRRTLFFLGEIGGNDFNYAFASSKTLEEMKTRYAPLVAAKITSAVEELIGAGAVNLVIPGIPPFGCAPFILSAIPKIDPRAYDENGCVIEINKVAQEYNLLLENAMEMLRKHYPCINIMYADLYGASINLFLKADLYGFDKSILTRSCCGVGGQYNFDLRRLCGSPETTLCQSPSKYIYWDGIHFTHEANKALAMELLSQEGFIRPGNGLLAHGMCL